jgi:release factor glutamine methyltransferase
MTAARNVALNVTSAVAFGAQQIAASPELAANAKRDAELLLRFVLQCRREELLANPRREITPEQSERFKSVVAERAAGKPIQYITGTQEFWGLELAVTPAVLIPRPETEHLVESALALLPHNHAFCVIDVGTGSGAIAIAIAHERPLIGVDAIDNSPAALAIARGNAQRHGLAGRIEFIEADLLSGVEDARCEMIVSNPPYVATSERASLSIEVREHEPAAALFSGATGYEVYERLLPQAMRALKPEGWLLLEIGYGQQAKLRDMLAEQGYAAIRFVEDLQGISRIAIAQKSSLPEPRSSR